MQCYSDRAIQLKRSFVMSPCKLVGAIAVLSAALATPARSQEVISEPGYCAFYYPYANCQNKGPGNPYTDPNYRRGPARYDRTWRSGETVAVARNGRGRIVPKTLRRAWSSGNFSSRHCEPPARRKAPSGQRKSPLNRTPCDELLRKRINVEPKFVPSSGAQFVKNLKPIN
jgi:hypothetical protein